MRLGIKAFHQIYGYEQHGVDFTHEPPTAPSLAADAEVTLAVKTISPLLANLNKNNPSLIISY